MNAKVKYLIKMQLPLKASIRYIFHIAINVVQKFAQVKEKKKRKEKKTRKIFKNCCHNFEIFD